MTVLSFELLVDVQIFQNMFISITLGSKCEKKRKYLRFQ